MGNITPLKKLSDCGDGYSVARITHQGSKPPDNLQVTVDLNRDDGTTEPRIIRKDGAEDGTKDGVDEEITNPDEFIAAYVKMPSIEKLSPGEKKQVCGEVVESHWPWWFLGLPAGTAFFTTFLDKKFRSTLLNEDGIGKNPGLADDSLTQTMGFLTFGLKFATTGAYTIIEPRLESSTALMADATYLALGGGVFLLMGGDPGADFALRALNDVGIARGYRHWGEKWGAVAQMGLGGVALGVSYLPGVHHGRREVPEGELYDNSPNPFRLNYSYPHLGSNLMELAIDDLAWGAIRWTVHLFGGDSTQVNRSPVDLHLVPGGGAMVGVDVLTLYRAFAGGQGR